MGFPHAASVLHFRHGDGRQRKRRDSSLPEDFMRYDQRKVLD
jgi:hypothetical protein